MNSIGHAHPILGKRIGKLVVMGLSKKVSPARKSLWHVLCDCGNEKEVRRQRWILNPPAPDEACCRTCRGFEA